MVDLNQDCCYSMAHRVRRRDVAQGFKTWASTESSAVSNSTELELTSSGSNSFQCRHAKQPSSCGRIDLLHSSEFSLGIWRSFPYRPSRGTPPNVYAGPPILRHNEVPSARCFHPGREHASRSRRRGENRRQAASSANSACGNPVRLLHTVSLWPTPRLESRARKPSAMTPLLTTPIRLRFWTTMPHGCVHLILTGVLRFPSLCDLESESSQRSGPERRRGQAAKDEA